MSDNQRHAVYEFMLKNRSAALATVDQKGKPHVATVYYLPRKNLTLYFSTKAGGRKFENMKANSTVAMAISQDSEGKLASIQLTGKARRVKSIRAEQRMLLELWQLRYDGDNWPPPPMRLYQRGAASDIAVMQVTPTEMVLADFEATDDKRYRPFFSPVAIKSKRKASSTTPTKPKSRSGKSAKPKH